MHPVEQLFVALAQVAPYPPGVVPMTGRIAGTAFFPGGSGLYGTASHQPLPPFPVGGVLVLGHNFDSEESFAQSLARGTEHLTGATWRPLLSLLTRAGISPHGCFFTNAYMGLIAGKSAVGAFPGARDPAFVRRCQDFLLEQLRVMQLRLLLSLGAYVPAFLAPLAPELQPQWSGVSSLMQLDQRDAALIRAAAFSTVSHPVAVVALTHPAFRHLNVGRRRFCDCEGDAAEVALLKAV